MPSIGSATDAADAPAYAVRGATCSSLRRPRLFVSTGDGRKRRLRFATRDHCLTARRTLKPYLERARRCEVPVFITPSFDDRGRIVDVGQPKLPEHWPAL